TVFLLLISMSVASWTLILWKGWKLHTEKRRIAAFRQSHAQKADWPRYLHSVAPEGSIALLIQESQHLKSVSVPASQREKMLSMHLSHALDRIRVWMDSGLTVLASIGSSAPFIGLFGTVWGIYHTLTVISAEESASLN